VTAWYLLAADTIDERIAALIDHKRAVVGSVTDGTAGADAAVIDRLLRELAADGQSPDAVEAAA
jgi:SNF2 family DNA or RNA helicase